MTNTFSARTASMACNFGVHPNQCQAVPVKSMNSHVMPINIRVAKPILIDLNIVFICFVQ